MIAAFCIVSVLAFMFVIWSTSTLLNLAIKMSFGIMMVWAMVFAIVQFGVHS